MDQFRLLYGFSMDEMIEAFDYGDATLTDIASCLIDESQNPFGISDSLISDEELIKRSGKAWLLAKIASLELEETRLRLDLEESRREVAQLNCEIDEIRISANLEKESDRGQIEFLASSPNISTDVPTGWELE